MSEQREHSTVMAPVTDGMIMSLALQTVQMPQWKLIFLARATWKHELPLMGFGRGQLACGADLGTVFQAF